MAKNDLARLVVRLEAENGKLHRELDRTQQRLGRFRKRAKADVEATGRAILQLGAIFGGGMLVRKVVDSTRRQEQALAQLRQGWISTNGVVGKSVDQIAADAARLQQVSLFGDEQIIEAQAQLLTFTNITGEQFDRTTQAALDLSTRMGQDLRSSVLQLGKALNDPVANLGALSRSGIQFSVVQKEQIKLLAENGQMMEAQAIILEELERQFGGSAKAARETFGGALTGLGNAFGDLLEGDNGNGGLTRARGEIETLTSLLQDPNTRAQAQSLTGVLVSGFTGAATAIVGVTRFVRHLYTQMTSGSSIVLAFGKMLKDSLNPFSGVSMEQAQEQFWAQLAMLQKDKAQKIGDIFGIDLDQPPAGAAAEANVTRGQVRVTETDDALAAELEAERKHGEERNKMVAKLDKELLEGKKKTDKARLEGVEAYFGSAASVAKQGSTLQKGLLAAEKAAAVNSSFVQMQAALMKALNTPWPGNIGAIAQVAAIGGGILANLSNASTDVPSFLGGGMTPSAPRVGGIDGKGGFPAILHPDEEVIDHRRSGGKATRIEVYDMGRGSVREYDENGEQVIQIVAAAIERGGNSVTSAMERRYPQVQREGV